MQHTNERRRRRGPAAITAAAAALLALAFGLRAVLGLFLGHVQAATGLGLAAISLALAVSQLIGGLSQPLCGALSDRFGLAHVVRGGALALCAGIASASRPSASWHCFMGRLPCRWRYFWAHRKARRRCSLLPWRWASPAWRRSRRLRA